MFHSEIPVVLIVEDEPLISMMIEEELAELGMTVVAVDSVADAMACLNLRRIDAAVLDFTVRDGDTRLLASALQQRGVGFILCTGSNDTRMEDYFPGVDILLKPYGAGEIETALARTLGRRSSGAAQPAPNSWADPAE